MLGFTDVVEQTHAKNAVDGVVRQGDVEYRCVQGLYPLHHIGRLRLGCDLQHGRRVIGTDDHSVGFFRQQGPETPCTTRQIEDQTRLANQGQCLARQLFVTPVGQSTAETFLVFAQIALRVLIVVLFGKIELDRAVHHQVS
ncbi:hypothetical protein D3C87_1529060 [compost metagenome]